MSKLPKRPRDPNQLAKLIVDIATGEPQHATTPVPSAERKRASARGGAARAESLSDRLWEIGDIAALVEKAGSRLPTKRGPYRKRAVQV